MKAKEIPFPDLKRATRHLMQSDLCLRRLIEKVGPCTLTLDPTESLYESIGVSIIYQQLHGKAAATIASRLKNQLGARGRFPSARKIQDATMETLKSVGLSESKALALKDLANRAKEIPSRKKAELLSDEELIESMIAIRGVGPWTAQMMLIFTLGRPDVLPTGDYGVKKGYASLYGKRTLPSPSALEKAAVPWRPYRSIAAWYLWRALDLKSDS